MALHEATRTPDVMSKVPNPELLVLLAPLGQFHGERSRTIADEKMLIAS